MKHLILFIILNAAALTGVFAQNETQNWYFGNQAGLDFSTSPPTILTSGQLSSIEGCAVISDNQGNLLFYSEGNTIWNKTHQIMANGTGLLGDPSSTQSSVIVKQPGNLNIYFIITLDDAGGSDGLTYSIVDMNLAAGMGSVTVKNSPLYNPSTERVVATKHCNGTDVWVVSHDYYSNTFRAHLLTSSGIGLTPVLSVLGPNISSPSETPGYMKFSPDGRKLGFLVYLPGSFELYDFDPATGIVSNQLILDTDIDAYGCEFSPDGSKFYGATLTDNTIFQWDLCAGTNQAIVASKYTIPDPVNQLGALQLASDGKIYVARYQQQTLGVIQNPNLSGASCNYTATGLSISPKISTWSLPNFMSNYLKPKTTFTHNSNCYATSFTAPSTCNASASITGLAWEFGDPASGASNASNLSNPSHTFSNPGNYTVQLIVYYQCSSDTLKQQITAPQQLNLAVSGPSIACIGQAITLVASGANSYTWNASIFTPTLGITVSGNASYTLSGQVSQNCFSTKIVTIAVSECLGLTTYPNDDSGLCIYPNPVINLLNIESKWPEELIILDSKGHTVLSVMVKTGNNPIDLSHLSSGLYFIKNSGSINSQPSKLIKID